MMTKIGTLTNEGGLIMKKVFYILFAATAALFVSCSKEATNDIPAEVPQTGETITFTATINMPAATKAALDGLNINWANGDYIGIATDNNAEIKVYPITVDASDATKCTITVEAVEGATEYYAVFKGSLGADGDATKEVAADDFSAISFDTSTKTFSGLTVGNQQVAAGSLSSHLWYTNGYPLAMAGKADGSSLEMMPCLALAKIQIDAESVPADHNFITDTYTSSYGIDHTHEYSAVRGFNLYQKGGANPYSSGDYTVQVAADGSLTTTAVINDNKKEYRQISQGAKLSAGTDYYMCLIPGGNISSFKIDFLGYKDDAGTYSWDAVYSMTKSGSVSVNPGDFFDLGTLNPLGRKKAKNEAEDEAEDEIAGSYVPAITIDGDMSDWSSLDADKVVSVSGSGDYQEFKVAYDELSLYFYTKRNLARQSEWPFYIWYRIDTNGGSSYDKEFYFYPYSQSGDALVLNTNPASSNISGLTLSCAENAGEDYVEFEVSVPRSELSISMGKVLGVKSDMNKCSTGSSLTIASPLTIAN